MTRRTCIKFQGLFLPSLIVFTGCGKLRKIVKGKHKRVGAERTSNGDWLGFTPYPAAHQLSKEFTLGFTNNKPMEIRWVTFATPDAIENVTAFYTKRESGNVEVEGKSITIRRGKAMLLLSITTSSRSGAWRDEGMPRNGCSMPPGGTRFQDGRKNT